MRSDLVNVERKQDRIQSDFSQYDQQILKINESLKINEDKIEIQNNRIKENNDVIYRLENVQIPAINAHLSQIPSKTDISYLKKDSEQQVYFTLQRFFFIV